jgi:hypothetical protein
MFKLSIRGILATTITAILATALLFTACKKDDETKKSAPKALKSSTEINVGFDPEDTYMTYGNTGEGYKNDCAQQIQVMTAEYPYWAYKTVYNFYVKNSAGDEYFSFCGNHNSSGLGEVGTNGELAPATKAAIIGALNYINNEFGSIDQWHAAYGDLISTDVADNTKLAAQFAIWMILDPAMDIRILQAGFEGIVDAAKAAVANPQSGEITIHFLTGNDWPNDIDGTQPQIVPVLDEPHFEGSGEVSFMKMKLVGDELEYPEDGEFTFELYKKSASGLYDDLIGVYPVEMEIAWNIYVEGLEAGFYVFKEVAVEGWKLDIVGDGLYFEMVVENSGFHHVEWANMPDNGVINVPDIKLGPGYGSVTATNVWYNEVPGKMVVPNANHFTYAKLSWAELTAGETIELAMVVGNKIDRVGTCYVKKVCNNLVIEIENFGKGEFGAVAFNKMVAPKNGNIHSGQWDAAACGALVSKFNHDNKLTIPCPSPNGTTPFIYLYIHCGTINYWLIPTEPRTDVVYSEDVKNATENGGTGGGTTTPTLSYTVDKNNDVDITIKVDNEVVATGMVPFKKNTKADYQIGQAAPHIYTVEVEFNGGGVKTVKLKL